MFETSALKGAAVRSTRRRLGAAAAAAATLVIAPMVGLLPAQSASADTGVATWTDLLTAFADIADGDTSTVTLSANIDDDDTGALAVAVGATVTLDLNGHNLTIDTEASNVPAIGVPDGGAFIVDDSVGNGILTATGGTDGAGIGTGAFAGAGTITILGGTVKANGGANAPGIGSGHHTYGGNVTISGGNVTANGGSLSAGIGGGAVTDGGHVTITGGTVTANGGEHGAGIGSGQANNAGTVLISGGTVYANGGEYGPGIGQGFGGYPGHTTITGGVVNAQGGASGAGIGSCYAGSGGYTEIYGGIVTAIGGDGGAGIGSARSSAGNGTLAVYGEALAGSGTTGGNAYTIGAAPLDAVPTAGKFFHATSTDDSFGKVEIDFRNQVTFDTDGGTTVADQYIAAGQSAAEPAFPALAGYAFYGWFDASDTEWNFGNVVTENTELHAVWAYLTAVVDPSTALNVGDHVPLKVALVNKADDTELIDVTAPSWALSDFAADTDGPGDDVWIGFDAATGNATTAHHFAVTYSWNLVQLSAQASVNVSPFATATTTTLTASNTTPDQGDSITMTFLVNGVDVTPYTTFTSDVATDGITGNTVKFNHASPHTITAAYGGVTTQLLVEVTPAAVVDPVDPDAGGELAGTGFTGSSMGLWAAALLLLGCTVLIAPRVGRKR